MTLIKITRRGPWWPWIRLPVGDPDDFDELDDLNDLDDLDEDYQGGNARLPSSMAGQLLNPRLDHVYLHIIPRLLKLQTLKVSVALTTSKNLSKWNQGVRQARNSSGVHSPLCHGVGICHRRAAMRGVCQLSVKPTRNTFFVGRSECATPFFFLFYKHRKNFECCPVSQLIVR